MLITVDENERRKEKSSFLKSAINLSSVNDMHDDEKNYFNYVFKNKDEISSFSLRIYNAFHAEVFTRSNAIRSINMKNTIRIAKLSNWSKAIVSDPGGEGSRVVRGKS